MTPTQAARRGSALFLCFLGGAAVANGSKGSLILGLVLGFAAFLLLAIDWLD